MNEAKLSSTSVILAKDDLIKLGGTLLKFLPSGELDGHFLGSLGHAARTDPLTKVHNKAHFLELLEAEFDTATDAFSIMYFDVDRFKLVNDTHGHATGDAVLKDLAIEAQKILERFRFCIHSFFFLKRMQTGGLVFLLEWEVTSLQY